MNFQDKRTWYIIGAVVIAIIIIWSLWPAADVAPPAPTQ